jgi:hypothetical protein
LKSLKNDIFDILETAALEALVDERRNFDFVI